MSLHDEIRDSLYGSDEDRVEREVASTAFEEVLESASYPHSAFKVLAITVAAEIGLLAMFVVAGDKAESILYDETFVYVAVAVFVVGFLIAFTTVRMFEHSWGSRDQANSISPSILTGHARRPHSGGIWIWFISTAAGVLNIILFYLLLKIN